MLLDLYNLELERSLSPSPDSTRYIEFLIPSLLVTDLIGEIPTVTLNSGIAKTLVIVSLG